MTHGEHVRPDPHEGGNSGFHQEAGYVPATGAEMREPHWRQQEPQQHLQQDGDEASRTQGIDEARARVAAARAGQDPASVQPAERAADPTAQAAADYLGTILDNTIEYGNLTVRGCRGQRGEHVRTAAEILEDRTLSPAEQQQEIAAQNAGELLGMRTIQELTWQGALTTDEEELDEQIVTAESDEDLMAVFNGGCTVFVHAVERPETSRERIALVDSVRGDLHRGGLTPGRAPHPRFMRAYVIATGNRPAPAPVEPVRSAAEQREHDLATPFREFDERRERGELTRADIVEQTASWVGASLAEGAMTGDVEDQLAAGIIGDLTVEYLAGAYPGLTPVEALHALMDEAERTDDATASDTGQDHTPYELLASVFLQASPAIDNPRARTEVPGIILNGTPAEQAAPPGGRSSRGGAVVSPRRQHIVNTLAKAFRDVELRDWEQNNPDEAPRTWRWAARAAASDRPALANMLRRFGKRR